MILCLNPVSSLALQAFVDLAFMKLDQTELNGKHSEIVAMSSLGSPPFLLMGFACGRVHVHSWKDSVAECLRSQEDHHCTCIPHSHRSLHSILTLHTASGDDNDGVLSVWCGTSASTLVALDYPLTPSTFWGLQHDVERHCSVVALRSGSALHKLRLSADKSCILALLHQPGTQNSSLAVIDTSQKALLQLLTCDISGEVLISSLVREIQMLKHNSNTHVIY